MEPHDPSFAPPDPALTDGVIMLRPWLDSDIDQVNIACQDPDISRFIPIPRPYGRSDAEDYVARTRRQWREGTKAAFAITDASAPTVVFGAVNLAVAGRTGNAAYWIAAGARRRGIAERALRLLVSWAFDALGLGVVILEIHPENVASQHVANAAGFNAAGHLEMNTDNGPRDHLIYSRLAVPSLGGPGSPEDQKAPAYPFGDGADVDTVHSGPEPPRRSGTDGPLPQRHRRPQRESA